MTRLSAAPRRRRLIVPAALFALLVAAAPQTAAGQTPDRSADLSGTWQAGATDSAARCLVELAPTPVEGTPYRDARRVNFPDGEQACQGLPVGQADIWVVEDGRLRLGRMTGPGQFDFRSLRPAASDRWGDSAITLTRKPKP